MNTVTYTFRFDGQSFTVSADDHLHAMKQANEIVRELGVTDAFAWFDAGPHTYVLNHDVLMD